MKAVNSEALPIVGVSRRVPFKLGAWTEELDLVVVRLDDFDVVLGMEFLLEQSYPNATSEMLGDHRPQPHSNTCKHQAAR